MKGHVGIMTDELHLRVNGCNCFEQKMHCGFFFKEVLKQCTEPEVATSLAFDDIVILRDTLSLKGLLSNTTNRLQQNPFTN